MGIVPLRSKYDKNNVSNVQELSIKNVSAKAKYAHTLFRFNNYVSAVILYYFIILVCSFNPRIMQFGQLKGTGIQLLGHYKSCHD